MADLLPPTELYEQVMGITAPWAVADVALDVAQQRIDVRVEHQEGVRWPCPTCQRELAGDDHAESRTWRYLDTCQFRTWPHARIPLVKARSTVSCRESLERYWQTLTAEQKAGIQGIAMDMWQPYMAATRAEIPEADSKIVFDRFHVMQMANEAVDLVRRREHRALVEAGDERLKRTKYLWLYTQENVPASRRREFAALRRLWSYRRWGWVWAFWKGWFWWATHSRLVPLCKLAASLQAHLTGILNCLAHPIGTGCWRGSTARSRRVKKRACGFRNDEHFRTAIFFHCGGLNLYPC